MNGGFVCEALLAPAHLAQRLARGLVALGLKQALAPSEAVEAASVFLTQCSVAVAEASRKPAEERRQLLDGLLDLRPASREEDPGRVRRRRMYQALENLTRFVLDEPKARLTPLVSAAAGGNEQVLVLVRELIQRKRELRRLSRSFGVIHREVLLARGRPDRRLAEAYRDAALENMRKRWNVAFHEWCAEAAAFYFLLRPEARRSWASGGRAERSRVTVVTAELRRVASEHRLAGRRWSELEWDTVVRNVVNRVLPPAGVRLRLLDLGSCSNYFGTAYNELFDVTAVDLAPAHESVFQCDALKLQVCEASGEPVVVHTTDGDNSAGQLLALPARSFMVIVLPLLLSCLPNAEARAKVVAKARQLLPADDRGLLIVAETTAALGLSCGGRTSAGSGWVRALEAAGFRMLQDPQMHFTSAWDRRRGVVNRAACYSFATVPLAAGEELLSLPVVLPGDGACLIDQGSRGRCAGARCSGSRI